MKFKNKNVIVTGGMSGIGLATVKEFLKEGANVVVGDINENVNALNWDDKIKYKKTDVTSEKDIQELFQVCEDTFGCPDVVFANAGIINISPSNELNFAEFKKVIDINLNGVFLTDQVAIQTMLKNNKKGTIINTGSTNASRGEAMLAAYCASKAGVVNLTRSLAAEFGKYGIRINAISPGKTKTPMMENCKGKSASSSMKGQEGKSIYDGLSNFDKQLAKGYVMGRNGEPEELAKVVLFLASDESSYMTGANILVDGGLTCH